MATPTPFDAALARFAGPQRAALDKLRAAVRAAAPEAEEGVSYGLAAFRWHGKPLAGLGATAENCAYYPMSGSVVATLASDLTGYDTTKGSIRFPANKPLPAALVKKLVTARMAEIDGGGGQTDAAVVEFLRKLEHPVKTEIEAVRKAILGVSPSIGEGVKWNAPSFRTTDYFATFNLRSRDRVQLVFHRGAKVKTDGKELRIADSAGLVEWVTKDRCLVTLGAGKEVAANRKAFAAIVRAWIKQL